MFVNVHTFGEAMRAVDERHVLTGEFVLVRGDVVSNVNLQRLLSDFKFVLANSSISFANLRVERNVRLTQA